MTSDPLEQIGLERLRRRTSVKWTRYADDVLPLWVAEMDVDLAEPVRAELERAVRESDTGYPGYAAAARYAEALGAFAADRWGWTGLDPARCRLVADVMTGATAAVQLVSSPGDRVVVNPPVYPPFFGFLESIGRTVVEVPLRDGRLDLAALGTTFAEQRPAAYFLCSPHNPTGTVHSAEELASVARLAAEHGVRVVVDEIHGPLVLEGARFTPYLSVPGGDAGFTVTSASKTFNLAGTKAALLVAGAEAAADLERLPWVVANGPTHLGVLAHTAALEHGGPWLDALLVSLAERRELLGELLAQHLPGVRWTPPQATYLSWLDCRELGLGQEPAEVFLDRGRVGLNDGREFGTGGAGHVRLNYATSREILTEAVTRMSLAGR